MSSHPLPRLATGIALPSTAKLGEYGGFSVTADPQRFAPPEASPILDAIHTPFSVEGFAVPRTPAVIGRTALQDMPAAISISDMVIKWPGIGYRLPSEITAIGSTIRLCADAEARINPHVNEYFAYLTLQRTWTKINEVKRGEGPHSDSIQGRRIQPKVAIEHGYTMVDLTPTRFFTHGFDLTGLDPDRHWLNAAFEAQADRQRAVRFQPGDIVLFDAYSVHEAVPAETNGLRTFFRLIFSVRKFDRLGNTQNALFDYDWEFQPRPVPPDLIGLPE